VAPALRDFVPCGPAPRSQGRGAAADNALMSFPLDAKTRLRTRITLQAGLEYVATSSFLALYWWLGKLDAAELSARKFQQVDRAHTRPDIALLLANILTGKHQYAEAAQLYRDYLAVRPDAPNVEALKKEAQRLEGLSAAKQ